MENAKSEQNMSNQNNKSQENCNSSDSESEKNKLNTKSNYDLSFDSENYQDNTLEVLNFSNDKLSDDHSYSNSKSSKLTPIPEIVNEESEDQSSSKMNFEETDSKIHLIELMKSTQKNGETIINKIVSNDDISYIICCENKNIHQKTIFNDKINELNKNKNNAKDGNKIEVDNNIIRMTCNQCIFASSSCEIF